MAVMLKELNYPSLDAFVKEVLPESILSTRNLNISPENGLTESQLLARLKDIAKENKPEMRSFIGCGYAGTRTPNVILRNILECPEWYTSYTPYQPEISQGTEGFDGVLRSCKLTGSRPSGVAPELSNNGHRPHGYDNCECFGTGRVVRGG